ncbi:MAG: competence/damage-inducible protein A [Myxococcota bacterium]
MRIEVLVVGSELLNGDLADTNTARLGRLLREQGLGLQAGQTVPDDPAAVVEALRLAGDRADLVLVTGGLGPTEDDLTIACAADYAGLPLVEDAATLERIRARFERRGLPFTPNNARQAMVPEGAETLDNPVGTAPGVRMVHARTTFFLFPGVPAELDRLTRDHLLPWLEVHAPVRPVRSHVFKTFGKTESQVATLLEGMPAHEHLRVAYRAHFPEIHVTLHVADPDPEAGADLLEAVAADVRERLGDIVYTEDPRRSLAEVVASTLLERGRTLATAESCTGGLVSKLITDVSGVSAAFLEGAVTYSNDAKERRLGIPAALLEAHGAVSEEVARAMAEGIREAAGADYGVSITGIAGPSGGTEAKPVGTVHFAVAGPGGTVHRMRRLPFGRTRNREVSAYVALDMVRRALAHDA